MGTEAAQLHAGRASNVMCRGFVACGDAEAALSAADVTVEGHFRTAYVEHAYIEPEAGVAWMEGDTLVIAGPVSGAATERLERLLTVQFEPDTARRVAAIESFAGDLGVDARAALNPLLATSREAAEALPEGANIAATLIPGADIPEDEAYDLLVDAGLARQAAYELVQASAMRAWEEERPLLDLLLLEPRFTETLPAERLRALFDPARHTRHAEAIVARGLATALTES